MGEQGQLVVALPAKQVEVENFALDFMWIPDFTSDSTLSSVQTLKTYLKCAVLSVRTYINCPPPKGYNSSSVGHSGRA